LDSCSPLLLTRQPERPCPPTCRGWKKSQSRSRTSVHAGGVRVLSDPVWIGAGAAGLKGKPGRGSVGSRHRLQKTLVAVEVAMALILLIGAGLMVRSLRALWRVDPGFHPDHAITFNLCLVRGICGWFGP
jgi:hypothetical protein